MSRFSFEGFSFVEGANPIPAVESLGNLTLEALTIPDEFLLPEQNELDEVNEAIDGTSVGGLSEPEEPSLYRGRQRIGKTSAGTDVPDFYYARSDSHFSVKYYDRETGDAKFFRFALMPAVKNSIRPVVPGMEVPGAQPGIAISTKMRHRGIVIPGGTPVYQSIGLESVEITLCGLLTGDEILEGLETGPVAYTGDSYRSLATGHEVSEFFQEEVIIPSVPVDLEIKASPGYIHENGHTLETFASKATEGIIHIQGKLLISSFRSLSAREARTYYQIQGYLINFEHVKRADPKTETQLALSANALERCQKSAEDYRKVVAEGNRPIAVSRACMKSLEEAGEDVSDLNLDEDLNPVTDEDSEDGDADEDGEGDSGTPEVLDRENSNRQDQANQEATPVEGIFQDGIPIEDVDWADDIRSWADSVLEE